MWAASFLGHLTLLAVILVRKRQSEFPVFTSLVVFNIVRSCTLFVILLRFPAVYFYWYWSLAAVDALLSFAILYECASSVFRPTGSWANDTKVTLWVVLGLSLAVGLLVTAVAAPATPFWVQVPILKGKFLAALLLTELSIGMMSLSSHAGLAWRTHVARICQGLGIYSGFCVIADAIVTLDGSSRESGLYGVFSHLRILVYLACLGYWTVAFWSEAPEGREMPEAVHHQLDVLQRRLNADLERLRAWK